MVMILFHDFVPMNYLTILRSQRIRRIIRRLSLPMLLIIAGLIGFAANNAEKDDQLFEVSKNLEIFGSIYQRLNSSYVDPVKPGQFMKTGIDAMLRSLDPYTVYYSEETVEDYRYQSTGDFGGIGAKVSDHSGEMVFSLIHEGFPAQQAGIKAGDVLLEINGNNLKGKTEEIVNNQLRGVPGTTLRLKIKHAGTTDAQNIELTRAAVRLKTVAYTTVLENNIGYIKLNEFSEKAADQVREALFDLKQKSITSLVLDLRDNPGGLVDEAIAIVNLFVEKDQLILTMRGRTSGNNRIYKTASDPVDTEIPIAVLVDSGSASASEIVAGSLQDLDRAVVIGQRSYGKGLVQNTVPLAYGSFLKLTIAKYYIPSGRCVQALDYSNRNINGSVIRVPDSLITAFKTRNGRMVWDGLGILPDIEVPARRYSVLADTLKSKHLIFDYATAYVLQHPTVEAGESFRFSDEEYTAFVNWVKQHNYSYTLPEEKGLETFRASASRDGLLSGLNAEYQALLKKIETAKADDFEEFKTEIKTILEAEIVARQHYQAGRTAASLKDDSDLKKAIETLKNKKLYTEILTVIKKLEKPKQRTDIQSK
jgi:carboxyl-terminal processing protease